jgi:hypothetical protein
VNIPLQAQAFRLEHAIQAGFNMKKIPYVDIDGSGNPHQEFLWGVQRGIQAFNMFMALLFSIWQDTLKFPTPYA